MVNILKVSVTDPVQNRARTKLHFGQLEHQPFSLSLSLSLWIGTMTDRVPAPIWSLFNLSIIRLTDRQLRGEWGGGGAGRARKRSSLEEEGGVITQFRMSTSWQSRRPGGGGGGGGEAPGPSLPVSKPKSRIFSPLPLGSCAQRACAVCRKRFFQLS